jgi:tRNA pseudouridine55 synthase
MDAVLIVDKPAGITSAEVVRQIKARVRPARVGHLGTLDPFATGLLPILIGEATKLAPFLQDGEQEYEGVILSAIKRDGVPLYRLARRGAEVEPPPPREVEISRLVLDAIDAASIHFVATCTTGTYMRSLARDVGLELGTVAHLAELRRLRNGSFGLADARPLAVALATLAEKNPAGLIGLREALVTMPEAEADLIQVRRLRNGDSRALDGLVPDGAKLFKVVSEGALVAVAEATSRVTARVVRVFGVD